MRVAFVIVPSFTFTAHARVGGPLAELDDYALSRAVVTDEGEGGRARVLASAPQLRAEGVRPQMTIARTRSKVGFVWPVSVQPHWVEHETSRLAGLLLKVSPQVNVLGNGAFWVGMSGFKLLGGETAACQTIHTLISEAGYDAPRIGVADTVIAARAAAVHNLGCVPSGKDVEALAPLPLSVLPLEDGTREALWALGIRTVGAFSVLPSSQLTARFGLEAIRAHRLANGQDGRAVPLLQPKDSPQIEVDFDNPFQVAEPAIFVLQGGLERLMAPHRNRGFGIHRLRIELKLIHGHWERELRPADPVTDTSQMLDMCRASLQEAKLPSMMEGIRVTVLEVAPASTHQDGLWSSRRTKGASLDYTLMRLQSRLGTEAVRTPEVPNDTHLPERVGQWAPPKLGQLRPVPDNHDIQPSAAWRLKSPPMPIQLESKEGKPCSAQLNGRWHTFFRVAGPQRIETGWWETDGQRAWTPKSKQPIRRDYWFAELRTGSAFSLFQDLNKKTWFLQGVLD